MRLHFRLFVRFGGLAWGGQRLEELGPAPVGRANPKSGLGPQAPDPGSWTAASVEVRMSGMLGRKRHWNCVCGGFLPFCAWYWYGRMDVCGSGFVCKRLREWELQLWVITAVTVCLWPRAYLTGNVPCDNVIVCVPLGWLVVCLWPWAVRQDCCDRVFRWTWVILRLLIRLCILCITGASLRFWGVMRVILWQRCLCPLVFLDLVRLCFSLWVRAIYVTVGLWVCHFFMTVWRE